MTVRLMDVAEGMKMVQLYYAHACKVEGTRFEKKEKKHRANAIHINDIILAMCYAHKIK